MSANSKIEWTDETWNPLVGCTWASPGCDNCYAVQMTRRLEAMGKANYTGLTNHKHFNGVVRTLPDRLKEPLSWKKPRMVFVNSMSDLFHQDVPFEFIDKVFVVMALANEHTFQVLTKRPQRMLEYLRRTDRASATKKAARSVGYSLEYDGISLLPQVLRNVWLGCSVEDQEHVRKRMIHMKRVDDFGWTVWVSYEPALGSIDWQGCWFLDWIVSGGESGPNSRRSLPQWHRDARDFCKASGIPYFFKQWGAFDADGKRVGKKKAGRLLDGVEHSEFPRTKSTE